MQCDSTRRQQHNVVQMEAELSSVDRAALVAAAGAAATLLARFALNSFFVIAAVALLRGAPAAVTAPVELSATCAGRPRILEATMTAAVPAPRHVRQQQGRRAFPRDPEYIDFIEAVRAQNEYHRLVGGSVVLTATLLKPKRQNRQLLDAVIVLQSTQPESGPAASWPRMAERLRSSQTPLASHPIKTRFIRRARHTTAILPIQTPRASSGLPPGSSKARSSMEIANQSADPLVALAASQECKSGEEWAPVVAKAASRY